MYVRFGKFLPDQPAHNNPGLVRVENALPIAGGWLATAGPVSTGTTGITGIANALWVERESQGTVFNFAGDTDDTKSKLYQVSGGAWADISRVSSAYLPQLAGEQWRHDRYGDLLFATNGKDYPQVFDLSVPSAAFDDAAFNVSFQARYVAVVRDFLVWAYVAEGAPGSTFNSYRVRWSALGDPNDYTPSLTTLSGFQDIPDLGEIRGLTGGEFGTILLEKGIIRFDFLGPPQIFQFDQIEGSPGCFQPRSVIRAKSRTYWYSPEGYLMFDGQQVVPIGAEKVDRFFFRDARTEDYDSMSTVDIPNFNAIGWGYVSANNPGDSKIDSALLYNYDINEWGFYRQVGIDCFGQSASVGYTLEELNIFGLNPDLITTTTSALIGGETVIPVADVAGWVIGYGFGLVLDSGDWHWASVIGIGASSLTIDVAVPSAAASGNTVQHSSIDLLPASLDSRLWKGGEEVPSSIKSGETFTITGTPGDAVFEKGDFQPVRNGQSVIKRLNPDIEGGGAITAQVGKKNAFNESVAWTDPAGVNADGFIPIHAQAGRAHRLRVNITGAWSFASGANLEFKRAGRR